MKTLITLAALAALTLSTLVAQQTPVPAKAEQSETPDSSAKQKSAPKQNADGTVQIKTTFGALVDARPSLLKLGALDIPIPTALAIRKMRAAVDAELKLFEDQRDEIFKKHGVTVVNGRLNIPPEKQNAVNADWKVLTSLPVKLTITPIPLSVLGESAKLSANDLENLEDFLKQ